MTIFSSNPSDYDYGCFFECPVCHANRGECCRTKTGRKKLAVHDTRKFEIRLPTVGGKK